MERIDRGVWLTIPGEPDIFQCVVDIESCNLRLCRITYCDWSYYNISYANSEKEENWDEIKNAVGEGRCGRIIKKVIAMTKTSSLFVRKNVVVNIYHANPHLLTRDIGIYGRQLYAGRDIGLVVWYLLRVEVVEGSIPSCPHWFFLGDNTSTLQIMDWSQTKSLCSISTYGWPDLPCVMKPHCYLLVRSFSDIFKINEFYVQRPSYFFDFLQVQVTFMILLDYIQP